MAGNGITITWNINRNLLSNVANIIVKLKQQWQRRRYFLGGSPKIQRSRCEAGWSNRKVQIIQETQSYAVVFLWSLCKKHVKLCSETVVRGSFLRRAFIWRYCFSYKVNPLLCLAFLWWLETGSADSKQRYTIPLYLNMCTSINSEVSNELQYDVLFQRFAGRISCRYNSRNGHLDGCFGNFKKIIPYSYNYRVRNTTFRHSLIQISINKISPFDFAITRPIGTKYKNIIWLQL